MILQIYGDFLRSPYIVVFFAVSAVHCGKGGTEGLKVGNVLGLVILAGLVFNVRADICALCDELLIGEHVLADLNKLLADACVHTGTGDEALENGVGEL